MRINAGIYRNHNINMCNLETTRETSDKVRQAIFNLIGQFFDGGKALDLFTGSGAMALEALSRGIDEIYLNDINKKALDVAQNNAKKLKCENKAHFYNMDYKECLANLANNSFDLIFLDPPYKMENIEEILQLIIDNNLLNKDGLISFEMRKETKAPNEVNNLYLYKDRTYGIKRVCIYKRKENL